MRMLQEIGRHPVRAWKTLALFTVYGMCGMSVGVMGPSLLDLRQQVQTSISNAALIMTARAAGHVCGSLLMGFIYSRINYQLTECLLMLTACLLSVSVPFTSSIASLLTIFVFLGVVLGFCEAGSNIYLMDIWGKETSSFMQIMHSMYAFGALIGPVLVAPFLYQTEEIEDASSDADVKKQEMFHPEMVDLRIPYGIVALLLLLNCIFTGVLWRLSPQTKPHPSRQAVDKQQDRMRTVSGHGSFALSNRDEAHESTSARTAADERRFKMWKAVVVMLAMLFFHSFYGIEQGLGSFLLTFAVKSRLHLSKQRGAQLCTCFWTCFAVSRYPKILLVDRMGNAANVVIGCIVVICGSICLMPWSQDYEAALWAGVVLIGCGASSVWACMYGFMDQFFPVTSLIGSLVFVSAVVGEFVFPVIISHFIESTPLVLMWLVLVCSLLLLILFTLIAGICYRFLSRH